MTLKGNEEAAGSILKRTLDELGIHAEWRPGDDPPDLVFEVENRGHWAVEVTELHQYLQMGDKTESRATVTEPLLKMCERVQAMVFGDLNKQYLIDGLGPVTKPPLRDIEKRAAAYIRSGRTDEQTLDDHGNIRIRTITSPVRVGWMIGLDATAPGPTGSLSADVRSNLEFALDRVLSAKLPVLATLTGYSRRILLIWRDYLFAEPEMLKDILATHSLTADKVDTILFATESGIHWVADPGRVFV